MSCAAYAGAEASLRHQFFVDTVLQRAMSHPWIPLGAAERRELFAPGTAPAYRELHEFWSQRNACDRRKRRTGGSGAAAEPNNEYRRAARKRADLIRTRLSRGFRWLGGPVAGVPAYQRQPFIHQGLVSAEHPLLQLFATKVPRRRSLMTGWNKAILDGTDSKLLALDCPYVEANKSMRGVIRVELDTLFSGFEALTAAIDASGAPMPSVIVGYQDAAGSLHRPHLVWLLSSSVAFTKDGRRKPKALFRAVSRGLTSLLMEIGADPGGLSNPMRLKNPLSPLWARMVSREVPYDLSELAGRVPLDRRPETEPRLPCPSGIVEHSRADITAQSNHLFRVVASFARTVVPEPAGRSHAALVTFMAAIDQFAAAQVSQTRAGERAARSVGRSIAKWTWNNYVPRARRETLPPVVVRQRQAQAGLATSRKRVTATKDTLRVAIASNPQMSRSEIMRVTGLSRRTLASYRHHIEACRTNAPAPAAATSLPPPSSSSLNFCPLAYSACADRSAIDKKEAEQRTRGRQSRVMAGREWDLSVDDDSPERDDQFKPVWADLSEEDDNVPSLFGSSPLTRLTTTGEPETKPSIVPGPQFETTRQPRLRLPAAPGYAECVTFLQHAGVMGRIEELWERAPQIVRAGHSVRMADAESAGWMSTQGTALTPRNVSMLRLNMLSPADIGLDGMASSHLDEFRRGWAEASATAISDRRADTLPIAEALSTYDEARCVSDMPSLAACSTWKKQHQLPLWMMTQPNRHQATACLHSAQSSLTELRRLLLAMQDARDALLQRTIRSQLARAIEVFVGQTLVTGPSLAKAMGITPRGARNLLDELADGHVIREVTERQSWRVFALF